MAVFSISSPVEMMTQALIVQGLATNTHTTGTWGATGQAVQTFDATTNITEIDFTAGFPLPIAPVVEFAEVRIRPAVGQVFPRLV